MKIMEVLTERQKTLLILIIRDYIESAQPVGSKRLVEHYHINLSTATILHYEGEDILIQRV